MILFHGTMKTMKIKQVIFLAVSLLLLAGSADAANQVYISVQYQNKVVVNREMTLPDQGTVTLQDSNGVGHPINARSVLNVLSQVDGTTGEFNISNLKYFDSFSAFYLQCMSIPTFVSSACNDWRYVVNGVSPGVGMDSYILAGGEVVYIHFGDTYSNVDSFTVFSSGAIGQGGSPQDAVPPISFREFDTDKAIQFLEKMQKENGSFGSSLYTDWAAVALGASSSSAKGKLRAYLLQDPSSGELLTDYERRAMALMALGLNPYSSTSTNYIQKILDEFDGTQFGDPELLNDDIFALIVLLNAGYTNSASEVQKSTSFILSHQKEDGSWGKDVDLTSSVVQALFDIAWTNDVKTALLNARTFLKAKQQDSGGFGNVYSTSWVMMAIAALNENPASWAKNDHVPEGYLEFHQAIDGGVLQSETEQNRIWATSYALPASLGKSWSNILVDVPFQAQSFQVQGTAEKVQELPKVTIQEQQPIVIAQDVTQQQLLQIQAEVDRIQAEVAMLRIEVGRVYVQHLATRVEELQKQRLAVQVPSQSVEVISQGTVETKPSPAVADSPDSPEENLAASVEPLVSDEKGSSNLPGIVFALGAGLAIFFLAGGSSYIFPGARKFLAKA